MKIKRPISDLIKHLIKYEDAVVIAGSKMIMKELPLEEGDDPEFPKKENVFFQPGENSRHIFCRKAMVKHPEEFWKFYREMIIKMPPKTSEDELKDILKNYKLTNKLLSKNIAKTLINFNSDTFLTATPNENENTDYIEIKGNSEIVQCVKCKKKYNAFLGEEIDLYKPITEPLTCECGGKLKPTIPFYGERYDTEKTTKAFRSILKYDENDKPIGLNTHTLILIGPEFNEDIIIEMLDAFNQFKEQQQEDAFLVMLTENESMEMEIYKADFGTTYEISKSLKKLIEMIEKEINN